MKRNHLLSLTLVALAACSGESAPDTAAMDMAPREVQFTAQDFSFQGPSTIEAGTITLSLQNAGPNLHHIQLVRIPDGMTFDVFKEMLGQMQPGKPMPEWFHDMGGVNPPMIGGAPAKATLTLEPGEYAVMCVVDTPDHVPHFAKGMIQPLTVTESSHAAAPLPAADMDLSLVDYAFSFSTPPTAGSHVIHVTNTASQSHEVFFIKLKPGVTVDDVMAWGQTYAGPQPFVAHGGASAMHPGEMEDVYVDFTPGEWMALCFVPDATDGLPHIAHGMVLPFTIS